MPSFFQLTVDIDGLLQFRAVRTGAERRLADFTPAFNRIGLDFRAKEAAYFAQGAALSRWEPLSARYEKWKKAHSNGPILTLYGGPGSLGQSFTQVGADGNITDVKPQEARFGSDLLAGSSQWGLARTHQYGRQETPMPARPMLQFDEATWRHWREIIREHVRGR